MTYKEAIIAEMTDLARDPDRVFVGYGLRKGRAAGTLNAAAESQIIECPVAENLMVGVAIGLSLRGKKPVVFVERADFLVHALDAIVNHLDKIAALSRGEFKPAVILRVVVGNRINPLFTGATHTQDLAPGLRNMVGFPVWSAPSVDTISVGYSFAKTNQEDGVSTAVFEYKDLL
jgi:pyruvate/2-oxoglutarate/acetoin dehydrogenase E1 component